ncbi:hypothetical protein Ssi03_65210 [Sphaerisporangium siamense]|uniref:Lipoprotein n=1 Tax=Sphaerisporangium siamense TaxID=795645 RepID=A0A7W7D2T3_9ACTN|nr:hypothetical protein [Sphaerisporangium siamense]MBB4698944.1 hypothetical protein [Sphaerisporangium siamense]GII88531.1 hypothetical protein Ssi03_65210 [Sphaerisporangium siamense]
MRRLVALAVSVLIGSVVVPTSSAVAQAVPDPVRALKRQLRNEHGVRISEISRYDFGGKSKVSGSGTRIKGELQLSRSGPVGADFTWWDLPRPDVTGGPSKKPAPYRVIRVGKNVYDDATRYPGPVPDGKKWIRFPNAHRGGMARDMAQDASLQPINVYDTSLMKALLKCSARTPVSGGYLYRGTMSYRTLSRISKDAVISWTSGRRIGEKSKGKVSWRLWTDRDNLLKRLVTADSVPAGKDSLVKRSDTRYTGWGFPLVVTAPPADEVIDEDDLLEYIQRQNEPIPPDDKNT